MDEWEVFPREAAAVAAKAVEEGIARNPMTYEEELKNAGEIIKRSRDLTEVMMNEGFIALPEN
jgi:malate dehydrogenase (oxaloacetate-decarboxylating)